MMCTNWMNAWASPVSHSFFVTCSLLPPFPSLGMTMGQSPGIQHAREEMAQYAHSLTAPPQLLCTFKGKENGNFR